MTMRTPTFSISSWTTGRMKITPMEPTSAVGSATIFEAAQAMR